MAEQKNIINAMKEARGTAEFPSYKPEMIKEMVIAEAIKQDIPVELALAVVSQESNFNNKAISKKNKDGSRDHGVFQLNDRYHKLKNVYDPIENIQYGIGMLKAGLAKNKGDIRKTLSDYNAGPNAKGDNRKAGDAYALKVMNKMNGYKTASNSLYAPSNSSPTGAAAPVGDNVGDVAKAIGQSYTQMGEDIKRKYIDPAKYDALLAEALRNRERKEAQEAYDRQAKVPTKASAEELAKIKEQYDQAQANLDTGYKQAKADIEAGMGADKVKQYYDMLVNADAKRLQEMQAANPYTRMAQMAPLNIDEDAYVKAAKLNNYGQVNANVLNPQSFTPRDFQAEQMRIAQARQLAQIANQTGLTPEQFIQSGLMDYNRMGETYNNQQQALNNMIQNAYAGDRQAQQMLANMGIDAATAKNILLQNQVTAQQNADINALNNAKYQWELEKYRAGAGQSLDPKSLTAANDFNLYKFKQGIDTINTNAGYGANTAQAYLRGAMSAQQAQQQQEVVDPYSAYMNTQKQVGNIMMGNPNVTAQDIQDFQTGMQKATMARYPETAPYFTGNYSQFSPANVNTFIPNQQKQQ